MEIRASNNYAHRCEWMASYRNSDTFMWTRKECRILYLCLICDVFIRDDALLLHETFHCVGWYSRVGKLVFTNTRITYRICEQEYHEEPKKIKFQSLVRGHTIHDVISIVLTNTHSGVKWGDEDDDDSARSFHFYSIYNLQWYKSFWKK